jgi:hypothetical protein
VKDAFPILVAGSTFAGSALLGLLAGIILGSRTGNQLWVLGGLLAGLGIGGYGAARLLLRSR